MLVKIVYVSILSIVVIPMLIDFRHYQILYIFLFLIVVPITIWPATWIVEYLIQKMQEKGIVSESFTYVPDMVELSCLGSKNYAMVVFLEDDDHPDQKAFYTILADIGDRWDTNKYTATLIMIDDESSKELIKKYNISGLTMMVGNVDGFLEIEGSYKIGKDILLNKDKFLKVLDAYDEAKEQTQKGKTESYLVRTFKKIFKILGVCWRLW